ncbi:hypothetical protein T03_1252 [Trichinella britovi]|uniref:Uncharacterized protein n=1 Tax=Trichinella britovi TaxID=45882 RepID=A0A0V1C7R0_TRIBR|nr:hypothetical protein T03_1252 [Trichinella britovi]
MSPSNVGNFGIGLVELVLGLLFLAGGWVISADDGVSAAASRSWAWRCMVLSLSISSLNSIIAASLSSSGMPSRSRLPGGWLLCPLVQCKALAVDPSNISVPILRRSTLWFGSLDWPCFLSSYLWEMFDC